MKTATTLSKMCPRVFVSALLAIAAAAGGCAAPSHVHVDSLQDRASIEKRAADFWTVENPPRFAAGKKPRVAIAEFSLEYVGQTEKREQRADLSQGLATSLPEVLYESFVDVLAEFDREVIPLETVAGSKTYASLGGISLASMNLADPAKAGKLYPTAGLLVLDNAQPRGSVGGLLSELSADSVIQVRLRVGLHEGHGVIEKGSTVAFVTAQGKGLLTSKMAIVSKGTVVDPDEKTIDGSKFPIDSLRFREELRSLFRPCISMALHAAKTAAGG